MCGIATIVDPDGGIDKKYPTSSLLQSLSLRGPDDSGELLFDHCWLGHRRLSIIDSVGGAQPMKDGRLAVTFNGEIYNYLEVKQKLKAKGCVFRTDSDTEVVLKAYEVWGRKAPEHLDGMFAFAIWNDEDQSLFMARDRFGKKPLYYFAEGQKIIVASEIKAILKSGAVRPHLDYQAIDNYLRLMYIPPYRSVYMEISQLPPAHSAFFKNGKITVSPYWQLPNKPLDIRYDDAKEELHRLLKDAVRKRMMASDVEIGAFLSGGLDSSLIAILMSEITGQRLKLFTISYSGHDELPYATQLAEQISGQHFVESIQGCLPDELKTIISYFDEPHADTSDFPQHLVSKLAAGQVKVVLSGDGADELFLGYRWHLLDRIFEEDKREKFDVFDRRQHAICAFSQAERNLMWRDENLAVIDDLYDADNYKALKSIDKVTRFDMKMHLPGQILSKVDRAGMMHGLEVRSPFLDTALVEFATNLPYEYKVKDGNQKYILKDILSQYMDQKFVFRAKQGFGSPIGNWLNSARTKETIVTDLGRGAKVRELFKDEIIDGNFAAFYKTKTPHFRAAQRLWVLWCLELWLRSI